MIYKTLKKVSDVCQLLDKRKYPATKTINGVTFTNNGDGTITVNGATPSTAFFLLFKYLNNLIPGHKYLLSGSPNDASDSAYIQCYDDTNFEWLTDKGGGSIAIFPKQVINPSGATNIRIRIASGYIGNNLVFKPQLFDLTEMYGAGNEPTTVEEFRQDFPEEMYDYKPYCFVKSYKTLLKASDNKIITSYKKSLACKTKNLLDISKVFSAPTLCFDVSSLEIGQTYTFSSNKPIRLFKISTIRGGYNSVIYSSYNGFTTFTFVMARDANIPVTAKQYLFLWLLELTTGSINDTGYVTDISQLDGYNLQIELGDTATEYHPYGYL